MSELAYHLTELEVARDPDDPRHLVPVLPDRVRSVLDIGCGIGQTLVTARLAPVTLACGIDIDEEALAYGRRTSPGITFVRATGERLPFVDRTFEVVISRVSLPFMHIPTVLREIYRVTKPGGRVWLSLHPYPVPLRQLLAAVKAMNPRNAVYRAYVIANGVLFHLTGRQVRYPLKRGRCESFQTVRSIRRALHAAGFEDPRAERARFFVATARRPGLPRAHPTATG